MIARGDDIPSVPVKLVDATGATDADSRAILGQGRVVFFTVPGAFTPTCHTNHLPGYLDLVDAIRAKGIDRIVCGAVNDHHVVKAWAAASGALGKIDFIADGNASLCRALGLERDMSGSGMGIRYIRAAIVLDNGRIGAVYAEKVPGEVTSSGAPAVLAAL
jgi:glutaredoxin/glutathione-dependent peroxiredoxin